MHCAVTFVNTECCALAATLKDISIIILRVNNCTVSEITALGNILAFTDYIALMSLGLQIKQIYSAVLH